MKLSNDTNIYKDIDAALSENKIVLVMIGNKKCHNCIETVTNIINYKISNQDTGIGFITLDTDNDMILSDYYQTNDLLNYPKTIIYKGSKDNVDFMDGVINSTKLKEFENLAKKS